MSRLNQLYAPVDYVDDDDVNYAERAALYQAIHREFERSYVYRLRMMFSLTCISL